MNKNDFEEEEEEEVANEENAINNDNNNNNNNTECTNECNMMSNKETIKVKTGQIPSSPATSTQFKIRINKTVHERLSLNNEESGLRESRSAAMHYEDRFYKKSSRSRSSTSRRSSYNNSSDSYNDEEDDYNEIKRTKKLQSVIAKAIDRSSTSIKCMFFYLFSFTSQ